MPSLRSQAGSGAAPVPAGNSPPPAPPQPQPQAAASAPSAANSTSTAPSAQMPTDWRGVMADSRKLQQECFWACHTRTPAKDLPAARRRSRPLMKPWMNAGGTASQPVDVNTLDVQIWDSELGSNDEPYTSFHVLARTDRDTVVGRSEQGEVYLRVVPTRWLPRDTCNQLTHAITTTPPELAERCHESAFATAAYERPPAGGAGAYTEPVFLILEGPLKSMSCNEAMRKELMESVTWELRRNGPKNEFVFAFKRGTLKDLPMGDSTPTCVQSTLRYDMRGMASPVSFAEVAAIVRSPASQHPYGWSGVTKHVGRTALLNALQARAEADGGAEPPATGAAQSGRLLTMTALGTRPAPSRAARDASAAARFVLCNGQLASRGATCAWASTIGCRCGVNKAGKQALSVGQRRKRCGDDGLTAQDAKKKAKKVKSVAWAEKSKRDVANQLVLLAFGGVTGQAN